MGRAMKRISTIVLNWNRAALLERTLASWFATVSGPAELVIVDNASADDSRNVISRHSAKAIFLDENLGGEALNRALEHIGGDLVHISENDQEFRPGWMEHARTAFEVFSALGQLSLHSPVPTDDEAWVVKPSRLRFAKGKILYEAEGNIGTSSILPVKLFQNGLRVHNLPSTGDFKLPDDGRLSADVTTLGLWCAWSDRYWTRNIGHELQEFERDPNYYCCNYDAKPWIRIEGWRQRIDVTKTRPRPRRQSLLFPGEPLQPEKTTRDVGGRSAQLWSMFDGWTAEAEVLDLLYTLVRAIKPTRALETGTWLGRAAVAIGTALRDNGYGTLTTIELDPEAGRCADAAITAAGLSGHVEQIVGSSLDYNPPTEVQFALLDSDIPIRCLEFTRYYDHLAHGALIVFHDTGPQHGGLAEEVQRLIDASQLEGVFLDTPRGLFIGTAKRHKGEVSNTEITALRARIAALESSTSWRVTRPLRALGRLIAPFRPGW